MLQTLYESNLTSLPLLVRGKVRDVYAVGDDHLLIVTTDRLSAFDVILPDPIPGKGAVLTAVSNFWFEQTRDLVPNHLSDLSLADVLPNADERSQVEGRAIGNLYLSDREDGKPFSDDDERRRLADGGQRCARRHQACRCGSRPLGRTCRRWARHRGPPRRRQPHRCRSRGRWKTPTVSCRSVIGFGAPNKAGTADTHGAPLGDDEIAASREHLDWPHAPFDIPGPVREQWATAGQRSLAEYTAWQKRVAEAPDRDEFLRVTAGVLPEGWEDQLASLKQKFTEEAPTLATRKASGQVLSVLTDAVPEMIGGSADLTGSVNTRTERTAPISADDFNGRYVYYGVREHAMAAVMNGIALHGGFVPYGGTFLVFADYMRAAMRLSALMAQRVIYVLTHDSIGLGEDGPTHQPVETLATLRALPNFNVYRPADAVETAECWALAMQDETGPSGIVLSRQGLPALRREFTADNVCARGAYVLAEAEGDRQVTLLATGSEVAVAMAARELLQQEGTGTAVVSMPCWELFDEQDEDYRSQVLGPGTQRVAVEAAVRLGWDRYIGEHGKFVGMSGFGASAPAAHLYEHFGITAAAVADAARTGLHARNT